MWLIDFEDWGVDYCAKDVGCEMKTLIGSDDPQSLLDLVGRNWNLLCVDRTGRGYQSLSRVVYWDPVVITQNNAVPKGFISHRLEHNPNNPVVIFRLPTITTLMP
jgi:hypothetical protein